MGRSSSPLNMDKPSIAVLIGSGMDLLSVQPEQPHKVPRLHAYNVVKELSHRLASWLNVGGNTYILGTRSCIILSQLNIVVDVRPCEDKERVELRIFQLCLHLFASVSLRRLCKYSSDSRPQ